MNKIETVTYQEMQKALDFSKVGTLTASLQKTAPGKSVSIKGEGDSTEIVLLTDSIKKISMPGHTSFTIPLKLKSPRAVVFQNLVIDQSESETKALIVTYKPSQSWLKARIKNKNIPYYGKFSIEQLKINSTTVSKTASVKNEYCEPVFVLVGLTLVPCAGNGYTDPNDPRCTCDGDDRAHYEGIYNFHYVCTGEDPEIPMPTTGGGGGSSGAYTGPYTAPVNPPFYNPCDGVMSVANAPSTPCDVPVNPQINLLQARIDFIANILGLDSGTKLWLYGNENVVKGAENFLAGHTADFYKLMKNHISNVENNIGYFSFVRGYDQSPLASDKMWWENDTWLDNPTNFNLSTIVQGTGLYKRLNAAEKNLILLYNFEAYCISVNKTKAEQETIRLFGNNGLNDKSDAFRHAYLNALNQRDCTQNIFNFNLQIAKLFSDAHETSTPSALFLEKHMDLFNNSVGHIVGSVSASTTDAALSGAVMTRLNNGELRYLSPLDPIQSPSYDSNDDGIEDCIVCRNGIIAVTQLTPTNQ